MKMGFLRMIGLVTAEDHARLIKQARDEEAQTISSLNSQLADARRGFVDQQSKFKKATTDLAAEVKARQAADKLRDDAVEKYAELASKYNDVVEENLALRPDAEAMRAKRKRDREQQAAKKEGKKPALPTATKAKVTAKKGVGK